MSEHQDDRAPEVTMEELTSRIQTLEHALQVQGDTLTKVRENIVSITADHIQRLFNDEVLLDSLAQRFMIAAANGLAYKAKASKHQAPELLVVESYIPGAIRAQITLTGDVVLAEQSAEGDWVTGDTMSAEMQKENVVTAFRDLLIGYGAELDRDYFIIDSVALGEFREAAKQRAMEVTGLAEEAPAEEAEVKH